MAVRPAVAGVAGHPHLVLADVGHERRVVPGGLADLGDDEVGREQAVAPGARAVPARRLRFPPPLGELGEVGGPLGLRRPACDQREQAAEDALRVAHDGDVHGHVLADLGRVDVDVDDPGVGRVGAHVAGHPVVEAHADGDEEVGRLDRPVDVLPAVHPHVAVGQRMGLVHRADPEQGPGDRDPGLLGEGPELLGRVGDEDPVAGQDDRPPRLGDLLGDQLELAGMAAQVRAEAGQAGGDLLVGRVRRVGLLLEGVLRDVDVDGAGPPGPGDVEGLGEDAGEVVRRRGRGSCAWSSAG